jgi:hypothetical protein
MDAGSFHFCRAIKLTTTLIFTLPMAALQSR